jgi:transaldolase
VVAEFTKAGINVDAVAARLQDEGAQSFIKSWSDLMSVISGKCSALKKAS